MGSQRNIRDAQLTTTKALPAAGAANYHDAIDLGGADEAALERAELVVDVPATPALVDTKVITLTVKDSANGTDFTAIGVVAPLTVTGTASGGVAASFRVRLPSDTRRYVRVDQSVPADAGTNTAITVTASLRC